MTVTTVGIVNVIIVGTIKVESITIALTQTLLGIQTLMTKIVNTIATTDKMTAKDVPIMIEIKNHTLPHLQSLRLMIRSG